MTAPRISGSPRWHRDATPPSGDRRDLENQMTATLLISAEELQHRREEQFLQLEHGS